MIKDLIQMINLFVGVVVPLLWGITERWEIRHNQRILLRPATWAHKNALRTDLFPRSVARDTMFRQQLSGFRSVRELHTSDVLVKHLLLR